MADLFVFDPGGEPDERAQREAERAQRHAQVRARYAARVIELTGVDDITADLVMAALFDHFDADGHECGRSNHPRLPDDGEWSHDAGFDCPCTWDSGRREQERQAQTERWNAWHASAEAEELHRAEEAETAEVADWLLAEHGVVAARTVFACPEVWEGAVDGRSFYFRERHGQWRIEIDLKPDGRFANRFVGTSESGELVTEPVELESGTVIAEGVDSDLGNTAVEHLAFIVHTVRSHLRRAACPHRGDARFCPDCGAPLTP